MHAVEFAHPNPVALLQFLPVLASPLVALPAAWGAWRRRKLRRTQRALFQSLVRQQWVLNGGSRNQRDRMAQELRDAARLFVHCGGVPRALLRFELANPETAPIEFRGVLKAMCRALGIDPAVLAESALL